MTNTHGYTAYANNRIMTASPAELTLMLYEGAIKFCNIAIAAIEKRDTEFQSTLNHKYPVAEDFDNVYRYLQERLLEANLKKDKDILEEVLGHLRVMRDTWKEVMQKANTDSKQHVS